MDQIVCMWCNTVNPAAEERCIACGAPLGRASAPPADAKPAVPSASIPESVPPHASQDEAFSSADLKKAGEQVEQVYTSALAAYGVLWRTLGEAFAIALAAFLLGILAGAIERGFLGALAGLLVGTATGLVTKSFWWHLLTPGAVILGALLGLLPWALGAGAWVMLLLALAAALIATRIGHRPAYNSTLYERLRPFLGAAGGLVFSLLGLLLGWVLQWFARNIALWMGGF